METFQASPDNQSKEVADFGGIALAFSGGGYRASAFHLGSLDFLHKVGLLERVTMLSTVSGGTITGAKYVHSLSQDLQKGQKHSFENFYNELRAFLLGRRLPDQWLAKLHPENETDKPSLIMAAADVYNSGLFGEARFDQLTAVQSQMHLKEIVFNTTELRTGIDFRFRIGEGGMIGNYYLSIPRQLLKQIRIADVVAASSCFPGGFEPIVFPYDFKLQNDWKTVRESIESELKKDESKMRPETKQAFLSTFDIITKEPLPLVDGGIYDNLGIGALLLADRRLKNRIDEEKDSQKRKELQDRRIGTLIISDTDNIGIASDVEDSEPLFEIPKPVNNQGINRITLKQLVSIIQATFVIFLFSTICFILYSLYTFVSLKSITLTSILLVWASLVFGVLTAIFYWLTNFTKKLSSIPDEKLSAAETKDSDVKAPQPTSNKSLLRSVQEIVLDWKGLLKAGGELSIADVLNLLGIRLLSFSPLFLAFLKGQRRQTYDLVRELENSKQLKAINNFIREIAKERIKKLAEAGKDSSSKDLIPSQEMAEIAQKAAQTATTLWFDPEPTKAKEELDNIIACGQFTICFKLLEHIEEISKETNITLSPQMQEVRQRALAAWNQFQKNPLIWVGDNRKKGLEEWGNPDA